MKKYKQANRTIRFDSRELSSPYRCKFGDKNMFEILRVTCKYGSETRAYEIESKYLPDTDSIYFNAYPKDNSFTIQWRSKDIESHIKRIK